MSAEMNITQFATYGGMVAVLALVASSGARAKELFASIKNLWLEKVTIDDALSASVYRYCRSKMKLFGLRAPVLSGCVLQLKGERDEKLAAFDILKQSTLCFQKGFRILLVKPGEWRFDQKTDQYVRSIELLMPRFMWNSSHFLKDCVKNFNECSVQKSGSRSKRFAIHRFYGANKTAPTVVMDQTKQPDYIVGGVREMLHEVSVGRAMMLGYKPDDILLDESREENPFDWYAFPSHVLDGVENARHWLRSKQWYRSKRIPWRRGWLIYGPPGSGKTLLTKCMAQDLDLPVFIFDLASMNNEEFETFWNQAAMQNPCMVLLEDFDAVFHGRANCVPGENKLTFDCILNCISGIESGDGIFLVVTTNHVEYIDPSLGTEVSEKGIPSRPGRIDEVISLGQMDETCRHVMASRILGLCGQDLLSFVGKTAGLTAAQFVEHCNRVALQLILKSKGDNRIVGRAILEAKEQKTEPSEMQKI